MTEFEARAILVSLQAGDGETIPTISIFRAMKAMGMVRDDKAREILAEELYRRRHIDLRGLSPIQPKLSARLKAIAEKQPEPPTFPAPGMTYGFPECKGWPEYERDYSSVPA